MVYYFIPLNCSAISVESVSANNFFLSSLLAAPKVCSALRQSTFHSLFNVSSKSLLSSKHSTTPEVNNISVRCGNAERAN